VPSLQLRLALHDREQEAAYSVLCLPLLSGFADTDLDLQLKKHRIQRLIVTGLIAHTCVEATVRFAAELGYDVTMVKHATADYSDRELQAAT
jgi:nicotinamidase-related amidase